MCKNKIFTVLLVLLLLIIPSVHVYGYTADTYENASDREVQMFSIASDSIVSGMDRSWAMGYAPSLTSAWMTLIMPVHTEGSFNNIQAELELTDTHNCPLKSTVIKAYVSWISTGLWALRFESGLFANRINGDYPCNIHIWGIEDDGNEYSSDITYILKIRDGLDNAEPPHCAITDISASLCTGENGTLDISVTNTCHSRVLNDLSVSVSDPAGDIIPECAGTFVLSELLPQESKSAVILVTVLPDAGVSPHQLDFTLSGSSLEQEFTLSQKYTVPVRSEIRLSQGGLIMADSVIAGNQLTITVPLMNMGKADIINAMATLELPGIASHQSVLSGTIAPGETKQAVITVIIPKDAAGSFSGNITVTGEDNSHNSVTFDVPFSLSVETAVESETGSTVNNADKSVQPAVYILAGGCVLLLVLLIIQNILLRSRIHRLEENAL